MTEHIEVLIVGAGLSGIAAAYHLQDKCPEREYAIFEGRAALGGTWDLFRYPGVRSDSDMYTLGYSFRPWRHDKAVAAGETILNYIKDTAAEYGIDQHIRYRHRLLAADWSSEDNRWTLQAQVGDEGEVKRFTCAFLFVCSGYYAYEEGYTPDFPGIERFRGTVVHPQLWPDDADYAGKRVVVIGSGATAVTVVPAMAEQAAHVTMLQRSPTYMVSNPAADALADRLRPRLSDAAVFKLVRWKNVCWGALTYRVARARPAYVRGKLLAGVRAALGPGFDVEAHFAPHYDPWDQRICLVPDGDLFEAMKAGRVSVVTGTIETFHASGITLQTGEQIEADWIVMATGLKLQPLGNVQLTVDGRTIVPGDTVYYKGAMLSGVPNLAVSAGYTNASWTLRAELSCVHVCRVLNHMSARGWVRCTPHAPDPALPRTPWIDFSSGYVRRTIDRFPKQVSHGPWRFRQNYITDLLSMRLGAVDDGHVDFA